jgi:hypothetical protein
MKWILDHIQFVVVLATAIAWWLNQRRQAKDAGEEAPPPERAFDDPELAERTRRIREEIQRKIEQRARGHLPPAAGEEAAPPELPPILRKIIAETAPAPVAPRPAPPARPAVRAAAQRQAEILEQQAALAERLREARRMKQAAQRRAAFERTTTDAVAAARAESRATVIEDLRDPAALRRAFVLREILGPPVALR